MRNREVVTCPRSPRWQGTELNSSLDSVSGVQILAPLCCADSAAGPHHPVGITKYPHTIHTLCLPPEDKRQSHGPSLPSSLRLSLLLGAQACEGPASPCERPTWRSEATLSAHPAFVWPSARQLLVRLPGGGNRGLPLRVTWRLPGLAGLFIPPGTPKAPPILLEPSPWGPLRLCCSLVLEEQNQVTSRLCSASSGVFLCH